MPAEVLVVDDGSKDETSSIVRRYSEKTPAIRLIIQKNGGPGAARNAGIADAKSEWIAFLDADDQWLPNRLELQMAMVARNSKLQWVAGSYLESRAGWTSLEGAARSQVSPEVRKQRESVILALEQLAGKTTLWTGTMLIRRDLLISSGGFNVTMRGCEDSDLWIRLALVAPEIGFVTEPLAVYTIAQSGSLTGTNARRIEPSQVDYIRRLGELVEKEKDRNIHPLLKQVLVANIDGYFWCLVKSGNGRLAKEFAATMRLAGLPRPGYKYRLMSQVPDRFVRLVRRLTGRSRSNNEKTE